MPLERSSIKNAFEASTVYRSILELTYEVESSITAGIPEGRIVHFNTTQPSNRTNAAVVGYTGTTNATTTVAGVVKFGNDNSAAGLPAANTYLVSNTQDESLTVVVLGTYIVELAPGTTITVGQDLGVDAQGRGTAAGGTGLTAVTAADGTGTADRPQFVTVIIK